MSREPESQRQASKYPRAVVFIIGNEFCERFSYYGMKTILSLYFHKKLHFDEHSSTSIYHAFSMLCYIFPIFGALLADMVLGKFKTIVIISMVYVLGHLLKTLAAVPTLGLHPVGFSLAGLLLIAIGTGGIKPCVSAFGGDQFKLPEQARQLQTFFSIFYFSINAGSLISTILTPALKQYPCFGDETCYSLAFGVPAALMLVATVIIVIGKPLYVLKPPQGNILPNVFGSIWFAIQEMFAGKRTTVNHWLDLAKTRYDANLVEDVKCLLRVLVLYLPLPVWWALFDQTGSRWTFQATRMNGVLGSLIIQPSQLQVANPLMILLFIPLFDKVVYPVFAKFGLLVKPLQRMTVGGLLTAASFFISGFLELELSKTYPKLPMEGESHLFMMNSLPCNISVKLDRNGHDHEFGVDPFSSFLKDGIDPEVYNVLVRVDSTCMPDTLNKFSALDKVTLTSNNVSSILLGMNGDKIHPVVMPELEDPHRDEVTDQGRLRITQMHSDYIPAGSSVMVTATDENGADVAFNFTDGGLQTEYSKINIGDYRVSLNGEELGTLHVDQGGVYNALLYKNHESGRMEVKSYTLTQPKTIHILWLIPQYLVITLGEVMFSITGLEFSYSQAPESMKSVLQAAWLLTVAFGNLIVIFVAEGRLLKQSDEFFMFACLMIIDMGFFALLAKMYVPREKRDEKNEMTVRSENGHHNATFNKDEY